MITLADALKTKFTNKSYFHKATTSLLQMTSTDSAGLEEVIQTISLSTDSKYIIRMWRGDMSCEIFPIGKFKLNVAMVIDLVASNMREHDSLFERMSIR